MGADRVKYIWTLKNSTARPATHYGIELWAFGNYDLGESLALMMGFLEPDPDRPGSNSHRRSQHHLFAHGQQYPGQLGRLALRYRARRYHE